MVTRRVKSPYSDTFAYEATSERERAFAGAVGALLVAGLALVAPFAHVQAPAIPSFVATVEAAVITVTLFTASMLYAQYRTRRHPPLAVLACGYALLATLHAAYLLTFPGTFAPEGLLGAGLQSAAWLDIAAGLGFAAVAIAYVYVERSNRRSARWKAGITTRIAGACVVYAALAIAFATIGQRFVPALVLSNGAFAAPWSFGISPAQICLPLLAAVALFRSFGTSRRAPLWLGVVLVATALQVVAELFGGGRYTLGWYLSESYRAVGAMLFFLVMQSLLSSILRRAAQTGERAQALAEIVTLGSDAAVDRNVAMLSRALRDLQFDWAYLARIDDDEWIKLESTVGEAPYPSGYQAPVAGAWVREAIDHNDFMSLGMNDIPWIDGLPPHGQPWFTAVAVPIHVNGKLYGFAGFANFRKREVALAEADRTFLRLVGTLAGATIQRMRAQRRLDQLAFFDALTKLPNRVLLLDRLERVLAEAERYGRAFAIHFLDLDGFKDVNDTFGHAAGDAVLVEVAVRLRSAVRESDTVSRIGGDEFVVLQSQIEDPGDAERLADRLRASFEVPIGFGERQVRIGTSIGTSRFPRDGREVHTLMVRADQELYRAKERRRRSGTPSEITFLERRSR
jgi:diguanylate cyclase (GGDEF)-like protein